MSQVGEEFFTELERSSAAAGVDQNVLRAIGKKESGFRNVGNGWGGSSAFGPFQFTKGTWEAAVKRFPEAGASDRFNPIHQAKLMPYFFKGNMEDLASSTGRTDLSSGDAYLAHLLGAGGAAKALRAGDTASLTDAINPAALAANKPVFGKMSTVGDLRKWASSFMGGGAVSYTPSAPRRSDPALLEAKDPKSNYGLTWEDLSPDNPVDDRTVRARAYSESREAFSATESFLQAWKENPIAHHFGQAGKGMAPDASFQWKGNDDLYKEVTKGLPTELHGNFGVAHSADHARAIRSKIDEELAIERRFAGASIGARAANVLGAFTEPTMLAGMLLMPEVALPAKLGRVGRAAVRAVEGAGINAGIEAHRVATTQTSKGTDVLWAAGQGLVLGSAFGALARNPAVSGEADTIRAIGESLKREALGEDAPIMRGSTAGAMSNPTVKQDLHTDLNAWEQLNPGVTAMPGVRGNGIIGDLNGQLGSSEAVTTRSIADQLVKNTVGRQGDRGAVIPFSASEIATLEHSKVMDRLASNVKPTFAKYLEERQIGWTGRDEAFNEFSRDVSRYVRNADPNVQFSASVREMGETVRAIHADFVDLAKNPGRPTGRDLPPLPGFENLEKSAQYLMRQRDEHLFDAKLTAHGTEGLSGFYARAFRDANPNVSPEVAMKVGRGYIGRMSRLAAGMEDNKAGLALSTLDRERMKDFLSEFQTLSATEIDEIAESFAKAPTKDGPARAKHRTFFNENYTERLATKDGGSEVMTASGIFRDDAFALVEQYSRQMTGLVGLHQVRVKNPRWSKELDNGEPEYLLQGLSKQADRDKLKEVVRADWMKNNSGRKDMMERDVANLDFAFNNILGHGDPFDRTSAGKFFRMVRDFNVVRLMNNVGLAQIAEIGMVTASMGMKAALEGIPSFKALWRNAKTGQLDDKFAQEVLEVTGYGGDFARAILRGVRDEQGSLYNFTAHNGAALSVDNALRHGKNVTSVISGMAPINTFLQRWAGQAAFVKFANMAGGTAENLNRLASMGVSPEMSKRIQEQIRTHATRKSPDRNISGSNLRSMNLEGWKDAEAAATFRLAVSRWARYSVLENDLGNLNRVVSSGWGKMITQFRSFVFGAWASHTLRNVHMRDAEAFTTMLATVFMGGLAYTSRSYLSSIGRSDQAEYLERRMNPKALALGAIQNSSLSSIIPMFVDTGMLLAGQNPLFDGRSSAQPSDLFLGNPTTGLLNDFTKGVRGIASGTVNGEGVSQADVRTLTRVAPFGNWIPWTATLNGMVSGMPEYVNHKQKD